MKIIFEDDFLLVINKPAGMVVNRADTTANIETVQDWINQKILRNEDIKKLREKQEKLPNFSISQFLNFSRRAGIVHRLDKETSGLLLIAKTPQAFTNLQLQFKNRQVKKKYLALVHGKVIPEEGEIKAPVGRLPWNRERFGVVPGGREAATKYRVAKRWHLVQGATFQKSPADYTFLELYPQTGRTHQIRVHLQFISHPIVGDTFYAGRKQAVEDRKFCPRVFLHASYIEFTHPESGKKIQFNSPLPDELESLLNQLHLD